MTFILIVIACLIFSSLMSYATGGTFRIKETNEFRVKRTWYGRKVIQQKHTGVSYLMEMGLIDVYFWKTIKSL